MTRYELNVEVRTANYELKVEGRTEKEERKLEAGTIEIKCSLIVLLRSYLSSNFVLRSSYFPIPCSI